KGDDTGDSKGDDKGDSKGDDTGDSKGDDKGDSKKDSSAEAVSLSMAVAEDIIKAVKMAQSPDSVSRVYINIANALFRMLKISNDNWEKANPSDKDFDPYTLAIVKDSESIETVFGPVDEIFNKYGDKVLMYIEQ
uniref:hypothetical protein n=1 Tax=Caloranaerobacter azorensis TaxID=116090 RepID=UPI0023F21828